MREMFISFTVLDLPRRNLHTFSLEELLRFPAFFLASIDSKKKADRTNNLLLGW